MLKERSERKWSCMAAPARIHSILRTPLRSLAVALVAISGACSAPPGARSRAPVPQRIMLVAVFGPPDTALAFARFALESIGETPVDVRWNREAAVLSTTYTRNLHRPGSGQVTIAAAVSRNSTSGIAPETNVQVAAWIADSVSQRRNIDARISNDAPALYRPIFVSPADSSDWARLQLVVQTLEMLGARTVRRP